MTPLAARTLPLWGTIALFSLTWAAWLAVQPGRSEDLALVRVWLDYWTSTWTSPYAAAWLRVDYPPHALVLLWPLAWPLLGDARSVVVLNLAASLALAWVMTRWLTEESRPAPALRLQLAFACMLLSWGAARAGLWQGQNVLAAAAFGVYAVRIAHRAPGIAGLALALAATKPTLGAGFGLILLLRGAHRSFVTGVVATLALTAVFDVTVDRPPLSSIGDFAASVTRMYTGESYVRSATTIRTVLVDLADDHPAAHVAFALYGAAAFAILIRVAWPRRRLPEAQLLIATAVLLWILLALPNQRYYLILLAPLVWLLTFAPHVFASPDARWPRWFAAGLIAFNVFDTPVALRRLAETFGETAPFSLEWLWIGSYASAGPVVLTCFVVVLRALRRISVKPTTSSVSLSATY